MPTIHWTESGSERSARWHSENGAPAPSRVVVAADDLSANAAYRLMRRGAGILWRGDYHNARQLLKAVDRRLQRDATREGRSERGGSGSAGPDLAERFFAHRAARAERAELLGRLVVELDSEYGLDLRRAPDVREACAAAYGGFDGGFEADGKTGDSAETAAAAGAEAGTPRADADADSVCISLSELLGVLGAYQWQQRGIPIPALGDSIHPRYGVFSPVRGEYVDLVAEAPLPTTTAPRTAFDLGTGTGVLAAILARRGIECVVATDINPRAVACARENVGRLGLASAVEVVETDLFPEGRAALIVCNPPWLPAQPTSALEAGIYDPGSDVLHRFLDGAREHLEPGGEAWLILSDLAERLGLRNPGDLETRFAAAGLRVAGRHDTTPRHSRATDAADPLHAARRREVTTLWRLVVAAA